MKTFFRHTVFLSLAMLCVPVNAQTAADYPSKSVRLIVPFPPGGATDVLARIAGAYFGSVFKQPFVIENRPGAFTQIGTEVVVKAPADGYTLLNASINPSSEQALNKDWPFKLERDMTPIAMYGQGGYAIIASNNVPIANLRDLVAYSKANPGKLNEAASSGVGTDMAILKHQIGAGPVETIVYKGGPQAVQAIVTGEAHLFGAAVLDVVQLAKDGKLKIIAYSERERHPLLPNVPTANESGVGLTNFDAAFWFVLIGPAGLPPEIVAKLSAATRDLVKTPDFVNRIAAFGMRPLSMSPQETRDRMIARIKLLEQISAAGVKLR